MKSNGRIAIRILALLWSISFVHKGISQIELNPTNLKFSSTSNLTYSQPNLSLTNHFSGPLSTFGNINYSASGKHIFKSNLLFGSTLTIDNSSRLWRTASGNADLLPYAYGKVEGSSSVKLAGTDNFTFERVGSVVKIIFEEDVADELVVVVTPGCYPLPPLGPFCSSEVTTWVSSEALNIVEVNLASGGIPFSFVAYKQ